MKIDITGRPNPAYDPATILADMQKAIAFFSVRLAHGDGKT